MSTNARNSDPSTSHLAAEDLPDKDRATVWAIFVKHVSLADFQMEQSLGGSMNGKWRKRRSDLVRDKLLIDSGRKIMNPKSGMLVIVWTISPDYKPPPPPTEVQLRLFETSHKGGTNG